MGIFPVKTFLLTVPRRCFFCESFFVIYVLCLSCFLVCSLQPCGHLLCSLVCEVFMCFVIFQCGVLGQVWYLIVSIPDLCLLTYFLHYNFLKLHKSCHKIRYIISLAVRTIPYNSKTFSLLL